VSSQLAVGFDLDMTLIDTVPGFAAVLRELGSEYGVEFPVAEMTSKLGPPLEQLLTPYLPEEAVAPAGDRFRELYVDHAISSVPVLPGAHEALAAVHAQRGRVVLVTGKFPRNAQLHVDHLGLDVDVLEGWVWGVGKAEALRREGVSIYVGDHVHDIEGARAADALSVSVLTGGCTREELEDAGTDVVLESLEEFPAWLDEHLLTTRIEALERDLEARGSVMVAYSGGADSAFLLAAAARTLGAGNVVAATGYSHSLPQAERDPAREFARGLGVELLTPQTHEMEREGYRSNGGDRCFFCKAELIEVLTPLAEERGIGTVATGTNADDAVAGFRPGIRAADERGAVAPLRDAGLTKAQVREASRRWGLPTWDKPAAACLSSRVAYGVEVTPYRLARVERAEAAVRRLLGDRVANVRVRDLGDRASVEVDRELLPLPDEGGLVDAVRDAGFSEVTVDPQGFRSGSMNERLAQPPRNRAGGALRADAARFREGPEES
jgi:pyridinium-3,5-biscarboxylic acid mononucleotide sulfurtransferase